MSEHHHIIPLKIYFTVAGILFFLTGVTVWVSYIDLGFLNIVIALLIAGTKATIVALFFMHLLWDDKKNLTAFVLSLMFLAMGIQFTKMVAMNRGIRTITTK